MKKLVAIAIAGIAAVAIAGGIQSAPADSERSASAAAPATDEERQQSACDAMWERKSKREQAVHDTEPKDPRWAYTMEQRLREYTSRRFQPSQIQVMEIDCRTTFCELEAEAFAPEMSEEFEKVISALRQESWNDFWTISLQHTEESGKVLHTAEVIRRRPNATTRAERDEEHLETACAALMARHGQRARAARDAELRDISWADPMEQLLRQHITTQLVKHPVDRLDVSCKTTFCQIKGSGRTRDSYLAFQKVVQAAALEQWSDLRAGGEGAGDSSGDTWKQEYTLYRDL